MTNANANPFDQNDENNMGLRPSSVSTNYRTETVDFTPSEEFDKTVISHLETLNHVEETNSHFIPTKIDLEPEQYVAYARTIVAMRVAYVNGTLFNSSEMKNEYFHGVYKELALPAWLYQVLLAIGEFRFNDLAIETKAVYAGADLGDKSLLDKEELTKVSRKLKRLSDLVVLESGLPKTKQADQLRSTLALTKVIEGIIHTRVREGRSFDPADIAFAALFSDLNQMRAEEFRFNWGQAFKLADDVRSNIQMIVSRKVNK